jgi:predicted DNA-binding transcriptional regulator AlpA
MPNERPIFSPLMIRERDLPALLGFSRATLRRAMAAGRFPACIRVGRGVAWRLADLERWIADGCGAVEGAGQ